MILTHERRIGLLALLGALPAVGLALALLWRSPYSLLVRTALTLLVIGAWIGAARAMRDRIVRPLQTLSNLLAALREDDFSIRARGAASDDALGQVMLEVNALSETLREQRLGAQEATALLRAVMAEIDVAIFAFDSQQRLVLVNRYGERLLDKESATLMGRAADDLGLAPALSAESGVHDIAFPGHTGRWEIRRTHFWQGGVAHELLVMADVSQPLREQEREAWQRLIRVIGHELNNSLAPIKSIAGSLETLVQKNPLPDDWRDDMTSGLSVIGSRADALSRFTAAYARLARLPSPRVRRVSLAPLIRRAASLETRIPVVVRDGEDVTAPIDADQIEQVLINVMRNAVDASIETGGTVSATWWTNNGLVEVCIEDEGPGLQNTNNLFVPFFTTKPDGSGIGLALSRQITEAHGGTLTLENRDTGRGARAVIRLPA